MRFILDSEVQVYQALIDNANVMFVAYDAACNILIWNKAAEEVTGYVKKDVLGNKKILDALYPDAAIRDEVAKGIGVAFKDNYKNVEFTLVTKYGDKKCISWSAILVKNKAGVAVGSFAVGIDVTIRNLVKHRERESFRALLKSVRYHEDIKEQYEGLIERLKNEINSLCKELSKPPRY